MYIYEAKDEERKTGEQHAINSPRAVLNLGPWHGNCHKKGSLKMSVNCVLNSFYWLQCSKITSVVVDAVTL